MNNGIRSVRPYKPIVGGNDIPAPLPSTLLHKGGATRPSPKPTSEKPKPA